MYASFIKPVTSHMDGTRTVEALVVSDNTPSTLPVTGAGVVGLTGDDRFAPGSILYVVADVTPKLYVADESGAFVAQ